MSIASLTSSAWDRRTDTVSAAGRAGSLAQVAASKAEKPDTQSDITNALAALSNYIPTELIGVYVAAVAVVLAPSDKPPVISPAGLFWGFVVATPIVVWLVFAGRARTAGKRLPIDIRKWPKWEMIAATVAFAVWALAFPDNAFVGASWYRAELAGLAVILVSAALGLIAPVVRAPLMGDN